MDNEEISVDVVVDDEEMSVDVVSEETENSSVGTVSDALKGDKGADGYSPTVYTSKSGGTTTIEIIDKNGTHTATINDGTDGADGQNR